MPRRVSLNHEATAREDVQLRGSCAAATLPPSHKERRYQHQCILTPHLPPIRGVARQTDPLVTALQSRAPPEGAGLRDPLVRRSSSVAPINPRAVPVTPVNSTSPAIRSPPDDMADSTIGGAEPAKNPSAAPSAFGSSQLLPHAPNAGPVQLGPSPPANTLRQAGEMSLSWPVNTLRRDNHNPSAARSRDEPTGAAAATPRQQVHEMGRERLKAVLGRAPPPEGESRWTTDPRSWLRRPWLLLPAPRAAVGLVSMAVDHYDVDRALEPSAELRVMAGECRDAASSQLVSTGGQTR